MMVRNKFTGDVLHIVVTPINGAHLVQKVGGLEEHHRGTEATARAYLANLVERVGYIWEYHW